MYMLVHAYSYLHVHDCACMVRRAGDGDDIFMRSMIENYALEEKTAEDKKTGYKGGEPTGKFWMDEFAAKAAASGAPPKAHGGSHLPPLFKPPPPGAQRRWGTCHTTWMGRSASPGMAPPPRLPRPGTLHRAP